eukprot:6385446-Alexandrium_andersonii.AAC.1
MALSAARNLRKFGAPLSISRRRRRRASRRPSGAQICVAGGSKFLQIPSRGEGRLARLASWDRHLPGWILGP